MHGCYFTSLLTFDYKLMVLYSGALHSKRIYCASKNNSLCTQNIFITRLDKQLNSSCTAHSHTLLCAQNFKSSWILRTEVRVWPFTRLENTSGKFLVLCAGKKKIEKDTHTWSFDFLHHAAVTIAELPAWRWRCMHLYCRSMNSRSPILVMMYCSPLLVLALDCRWMYSTS